MTHFCFQQISGAFYTRIVRAPKMVRQFFVFKRHFNCSNGRIEQIASFIKYSTAFSHDIGDKMPIHIRILQPRKALCT